MRWGTGKAVNTESTKTLVDLVAKRHLCLRQMRDLGRKQSEFIAAGDMSSLLRLIAAKNQLIVALQAIEQKLAPFHNQHPESRQWSSEKERGQCAKLVSECNDLLEEVMRLERENEEQMTLRRDEVASQLQAAQAASTARGAYQAQQNWTPQAKHAPTPNITTNYERLDLESKV